MKIAKKILIIAAALIIGFIIGWRVTVAMETFPLMNQMSTLVILNALVK